MNSQKSIYVFSIMGTLVALLVSFEMASTQDDLQQAIEEQLNQEQLNSLSPDYHASDPTDYQLLKRKRRYLEFPEGSSFQLVYDLIIGVVDFTNYLILGVTVALAWELPSKPPSEIFNDFAERLKDGTLGTSRNDTVQNIKYINSGNNRTTKTPVNLYNYKVLPVFRAPMHYQYYKYQTPEGLYKYPSSKSRLRSNLYKLNRYTNNNNNSWHNIFYTPKQQLQFPKWTQNNNLPKFSVKSAKYPWWNLRERLKNSFTSRPSIRRFDKNINYARANYNNKERGGRYSTFAGKGRSVHRIYPVFGKRSISSQQLKNKNLSSTQHRYRRSGIITDELSKLDRIHIQHHRKTRHDLYERIEIYLNGRGSHGHHCVLRALCETGHKSNEHQPGSFVGELMRAIFTMPEPLDQMTDGSQHIGHKELRYDAANAFEEDCATRYSHCKDSLWSSHFVL